MRKVGEYIATILIVIGFILIIGTAGASDNDAIGLKALIIQGAIGCLSLIGGYILGEKLGGYRDFG